MREDTKGYPLIWSLVVVQGSKIVKLSSAIYKHAIITSAGDDEIKTASKVCDSPLRDSAGTTASICGIIIKRASTVDAIPPVLLDQFSSRLRRQLRFLCRHQNCHRLATTDYERYHRGL